MTIVTRSAEHSVSDYPIIHPIRRFFFLSVQLFVLSDLSYSSYQAQLFFLSAVREPAFPSTTSNRRFRKALKACAFQGSFPLRSGVVSALAPYFLGGGHQLVTRNRFSEDWPTLDLRPDRNYSSERSRLPNRSANSVRWTSWRCLA
jgi:hypothetical protein